MRSIGKVNIKKLKKIVEEEYKRHQNNCRERIEARIHAEHEDWYDSWESAWSEIERLVDDELQAWTFGRLPLKLDMDGVEIR